MAASNLINDNEEYIKDAIDKGISGEAVESVLEDVINKSDEIGKTPKQVKEVVETIVDIKQVENTKVDEKYASDFVKNNIEKIESALEDGLSQEEIAKTLIEKTEKANDHNSKKYLNFIIKLISKMKKKELKLNKEKQNIQQKGYQKVLSDK